MIIRRRWDGHAEHLGTNDFEQGPGQTGFIGYLGGMGGVLCLMSKERFYIFK